MIAATAGTAYRVGWTVLNAQLEDGNTTVPTPIASQPVLQRAWEGIDMTATDRSLTVAPAAGHPRRLSDLLLSQRLLIATLERARKTAALTSRKIRLNVQDAAAYPGNPKWRINSAA